MCFSDMMLSNLIAKILPLVFCCAIHTFVFFHSVLLSQFFIVVYDFFRSGLMTLGLKLYLLHEKIFKNHFTFNSFYLKA